ncbi:MAG TPA: PASTA domain-containing protein [Flavobacteriales bacterium]|nr:PASTA domain-containing protein [Flavobacteriales bacterium]HHZ94487.1 PASTA domain-containing protein [Flavobacteriales bacterium]HIO15382.1 PASTA domain-containing protein [Flavobacteriales bacterium]
MSLRRFVFSKAFLKSILVIGISWVVLIGGSMLFLQLNSRPWSERLVPDLTSLSKDSAFLVLEELELVPIHLDSVYSSFAVPGSVLEQSPPAGSSVKSGRPIYLTTFRITPPDERIGVFEGQDARLALNILESKGFKVEERQEPNLILEGKVVRVESRGFPLGPDDRRQRDSKIVLVVGKASSVRVRIPWLSGLTLIDATERLTESSLSLGHVEYGDSIFTAKDSTTAQVARQYPSSSSGVVKAGTSVDLVLRRSKQLIIND